VAIDEVESGGGGRAGRGAGTSLGREGLADLVPRSCRHASRFADGLRGAGYAILNDVVVNQVLVSFGEPEMPPR
jgi:glutamate/tyrosine decarboxylase-like PLP-dependent enzyme